MYIITQKAGIRPGGLVLQDKNKNPINRRPCIAVHGTAGNDRDLQRLESFFGLDSPYVSRRHHRDSRGSWGDDLDNEIVPEQPEQPQEQPSTEATNSPSPQFPAIATEKLFEAPTAALERLNQLTSEQITNLQNASQQAGAILNDLKGTVEAGAGGLLSNLEDAQRQLAPEVATQVEKIGIVLEKQVNEAQNILMKAINAIKQQAEALSQHASSIISSSSPSGAASSQAQKQKSAPPPVPRQQQKQQVKKESNDVASEIDSVAARFKTELQQITEKVKTLSEDQLNNVQEVVGVLEQELGQRAEQMRSLIYEKRVEINQIIGQLTTKSSPPAAGTTRKHQPQQQRMAPAVVVKKATSAPSKKATVISSQQKSSFVDYPVQQLGKTAEAVKGMWQEQVQTKIKMPLISVPAPLVNFDAAKIKTAAAENPQAVALGAGVLAVTALGVFLRTKAGNRTQAEQDAIQRARSRRRLERQRNRFKKALGNKDDGTGMIDSSVFAAVQRISKTSKSSAAATDERKAEEDVVESVDDDDEDDKEESGALGDDPQSWDPAMKKEWNKFVKSSRLKDANLWDASDIDEGLPEIYVDLERD